MLLIDRWQVMKGEPKALIKRIAVSVLVLLLVFWTGRALTFLLIGAICVYWVWRLLLKRSLDVRVAKAFKLHSQGNISEAARYYQLFLDKGFTNPRVLSNYGAICQQRGQADQAVKLYRKSIELYPNHLNSHSNLGGILRDQGKLEEAEVSTRKAIELKPDHSTAYCNLGGILSDQGKLEEAEVSTRKAIELKPDNAAAYCNLGNIFRDQGKLQEAEFSIRKAIELNPDFSNAHSDLGNILRERGKLQEAELSARKAIELNPDNAIAHCSLGNILSYQEKLQEAELYIRKAIELSPDNSVINCNMGGILKRLGRSAQAKFFIQKAMKLNPDLSDSYFFLSTLEASTSANDWEAYLFSNDILKNQNYIHSINIYFARANILDRKMKYAKAADMLTRANTLNRKLYGSNFIPLASAMKNYFEIAQEIKSKVCQQENLLTSIFVVGLPRSGKTIVESILACNDSLAKCGESNSLEIAVKRYLDAKRPLENTSLYQLYIKNFSKKLLGKSYVCTTTPIDYIYTGLIASQIPKSRIIYCHRNPLDNIKEMYSQNIWNRYTFKCSIAEAANMRFLIDSLMDEYKNIFSSKLYFLNYDDLVTHPEKEIKCLLRWLGWGYDAKYLQPKIDPTTHLESINNNLELNSKFLHSWRNYRQLLQPAVDIFRDCERYRDFID